MHIVNKGAAEIFIGDRPRVEADAANDIWECEMQ